MPTIRALLFDLDGVLFDGRDFHRQMFLDAVLSIYPNCIDEKYHNKYLDGLSTKQKITALVNAKRIPVENAAIFETKQRFTVQNIGRYIGVNPRVSSLLQEMSTTFQVICVSNAIKATVIRCLDGLGVTHLFADIISNEDCTENKPSSQPYLLAFQRNKLLPEECLIFEDSEYGRTAAYMSGAWVVPIVDVYDVTREKIVANLNAIQTVQSNISPIHLNIVVPMAGLGSRFQKAGYSVPKPFISVLGKPMIQWVIENMLSTEERYGTFPPYIPFVPTFHFIVQRAHLEKYNFAALCDSLHLTYSVTPIDTVTEGAACTTLLVKERINNDTPLVTVNSDQFLEWNQNEFYRALTNSYYDGCISVFEQKDPNDIKWSYSRIDDMGLIREVAEKKYISRWATTGVYGWKRGADYVRYAESMISKNIRVNNEFYVCPVYNEAIADGRRIRNCLCKKIWGLGVPEDLEKFVNTYSNESVSPKTHG